MIGKLQQRQGWEYYQDPFIVTIAAGASVSSQIEIRDLYARGLAVLVLGPWTAANIGLQVSMNGGTGGTWTPLYDQNGARVQITNISATARQLYITPPEAWGMMRYNYVRLASLNTSTGAALNQVQARTLEVSILA